MTFFHGFYSVTVFLSALSALWIVFFMLLGKIEADTWIFFLLNPKCFNSKLSDVRK